MKNLLIVLLFSAIVGSFFVTANAQSQPKNKSVRETAGRNNMAEFSPELQQLLQNAVDETAASFSAQNLKSEQIAATLIDLRDAKNLKMASVRGNEKIYPASVVKMFYMVALENLLETGKIKNTPELERGLHDMIVNSSNEATQYILDVITGTSSGAELPPKEFANWAYKRNAVNRYFAALGYQNINVNQKTFCEDAYGIEQQFRGYRGENRNMLTTDATARLLAEIVSGKAATPARTAIMLNLMKRDFSGLSSDNDDQAHGFSGIALNERNITNAKLWSKAGWTSKARHDAAYIETPDGLKFVLVVFTENAANERGIIPMIAGKILDNLGKIN